MRVRKQSTELEYLSAGLGSVEDPYYIKDLLKSRPPELAPHVNREFRYTVISMIRAGRYLMAIKNQLEFGDWEDFVDEQRWPWEYVRASMKFLEVVARCPQALRLPSAAVIKRIYHIPIQQVEDILNELPAESIEKLTPGDLQRIYEEKVKENRKAKPIKRKTLTPEERLKEEKALSYGERTPFDDAWDGVIAALRKLATVPITERDRNKIFEPERMVKLGEYYKNVVEHLHPTEEITKRATIINPSLGNH